jgi:hypothetical protein
MLFTSENLNIRAQVDNNNKQFIHVISASKKNMSLVILECVQSMILRCSYLVGGRIRAAQSTRKHQHCSIRNHSHLKSGNMRLFITKRPE